MRSGHDAGNDEGAAMLEFVWLVVLLVIPLVYLVLTIFDVQRAAFGASSAAREAGRIFVLSSDGRAATQNAMVATRIVMADQDVPTSDVSLDVRCAADPCLTPGASVTVTVRSVVRLPLVPTFLNQIVPTAIPVQSTYTQVVDQYVAQRP